MFTVATREMTGDTEGLTTLVEAARRGDRAACATLLRRYRRVALAYALTRLRDPDAAEDATQEAIIKALGGLDGLRRAERFGPWLMQLVRHQCEDAARRRKVRAAEPLDERWEADLPTPEGLVLDADRRLRLRRAIGSLPEGVRVPVLLFYASGLSYREIALALELKETTVQGRLAQGLRLLRRRLRPEDFE
jgi:RNA polymerase sigma-70 factor, ECF subfamily